MSGRRFIEDEAGWALLAGAREIHLAGVADGRPVLRTMHAVVHEGALWLHGVPRGSVAALEGTEVTVQAEQIVVRIPSWMRDPERACPATTYYRSVIADGELVAVDDPVHKARALQTLMEVQQPEGGYVPLDATHPLYAGKLRGIGMWKVTPRSVSAVEKLGQDQSAAHVRGILRGLWARGEPGDHAAIEAISTAHPEHPRFADVPGGFVPRCSPSRADARAAAHLVRGTYWNTEYSEETLAEAVLHSSAWVGLERDGVLVATARAISDRAKRSWVYDVCVDGALQRTGAGTVLMELLLHHPAVRATEVNLATRDAMGFYARLGFHEVWTDTRGDPRTLMRRPATG